MEGIIGEIRMFAGNFAPRGWMFCAGQILSIAQNTALFSILGTTYGGNGQTTFALPDLRGRVPLGPGQGPGLHSHNLGDTGGEETHTLINTEMPAHSHATQAQIKAASGAGTSNSPTNNYPASSTSGNTYGSNADTALNGAASQITVGIAGGSQPHNNMQPYNCVNFIICMEGIYPSRN
jgi:microcystin-dependent protein